ncbi:hypothetical protein LPJ59_005340 [Coemansia sp. RSA 2399]|nr:hypothetical protein LPJ59_005340 [Coemansia sp. RSA 2399]KAJ1904890.1 hypothetical protein LPJ81_002228 [Coemansia sp. IMI 209127]
MDTEHLFSKTRELNLLGQPKWPVPKTLLAFLGLSLVMYLVCAAETAYNEILGTVMKELESTLFAQWIAAAFLLTCVMVQPVWVKLAEKFGRKWPLFASILIFMVFSAMVGGAQTMVALCVGRALQGVGGAGMMPLALVVLTDILTPGERGIYMGVLGAVIVLGKWTGPSLGAAFIEKSTWRWAGYYNLPVGAVALAILYLTLHDLPTPPGAMKRKIREFDYIGTVLWMGGSSMILLGLSLGGNEHPWRSAIIVCLFVFGFIVTLLFGVVEGKWAKWPIIPLWLLARRRVLLPMISSFFIGFCLYGMIMFVPIYYSAILGQGSLQSVRHLLWCALGGCIGAIVAGCLVQVRQRCYYREWAVLGTAMMAIGYGLMYIWPLDADATAKHAGYQMLIGLGLGFSMQQVLLSAQAGLPANEISTATTLIDYARTLGGMVGLVIGEVILKEKIFQAVDEMGFGSFVGTAGGGDFVQLESMLPMLHILPSSVSLPIYNGLLNAIHYVFITDVPFAAAACILCMFVSNVPLHHILPATNSEELLETQRNLHSSSDDGKEQLISPSQQL